MAPGSWFRLLLLSVLVLPTCLLLAGDLSLEAKLIWASNEPNSPDPNHKKLDSELTKWLEKHHAWKYYFQENVQKVALKGTAPTKVQMSKECRLEITHLGNSRIEVKLYGKDKLVARVVDEVPTNNRLVIAGDSKSDTAWFIAIKQTTGK